MKNKTYKYVRFIHASGVEFECSDASITEMNLFNENKYVVKSGGKSFLATKILDKIK